MQNLTLCREPGNDKPAENRIWYLIRLTFLLHGVSALFNLTRLSYIQSCDKKSTFALNLKYYLRSVNPKWISHKTGFRASTDDIKREWKMHNMSRTPLFPHASQFLFDPL